MQPYFAAAAVLRSPGARNAIIYGIFAHCMVCDIGNAFVREYNVQVTGASGAVMKRKAIITVAALARREDGTTEQSAATARGSWEAGETGWRAEYSEPEEGALTRLDFTADGVLWTLSGTMRSCLRFAPGEVCAAVCETSWGSFSMEARTELLRAELDETGGMAELVYELRLGGGAPDSRRLCIEIETEAET